MAGFLERLLRPPARARAVVPGTLGAGLAGVAAANPPAAAVPAAPVPLTRVGQVRLDAAGAGTASVFCPGMDWVVDSRGVSIAGATASGASASEYLNGVSDLRYLQGTYDGANDSSGRRQLLQAGDVLYVVWAGGPANAIATFRASGLAYPAGQGRANL